MSIRTEEQAIHDRINLPRMVHRLQKSVDEDTWPGASDREAWMKVQGKLQNIKHARLLLKNVRADDPNPVPHLQQKYDRFENVLDQLQRTLLEIDERVAPPPRRPRPILPSLPPPSTTKGDSGASEPAASPGDEVPAEEPPLVDSLIPSSEAELPPPSELENSLLPPTLPAATSKLNATPTIIQNSRARQEELSEQLALMATQLKRNATHFSDSLEKDKSAVEDLQEKLDSNFDVMKKERLRLRDFRGKSGSTTCLVIMSIIAVLVSFIMMVFFIRVT
ncbi:hypothetical protein CONPUDRAFT_152221 [Coniophora puteana RWD-64-598 SS2]|uniref:t-SNARE coiled-coil homology domain-containing protein n=1 Tax=Coniophora puteana (strain RWD-64-598) TaxID=741705 RepID=A0A5M3MW17_CONPW|nr:uncharacterized protein CONPUDRAFT_152221 [Coniophora puteana RWD-64-598 SS2]EIW83187.1 hypothetical protein CONPUDRAFT_152221 [Coniophora puteana RWD-64-598 SS2]